MNVLIISAHPDDEVIGCGGTIARHAAAGDTVHILIVAEGATSRQNGSADDVGRLRDATERAAAIMGAEPPRMLGFPDNRLDSMDRLDIIKEMESQIEATRPDTVYTHHGGDLNIDHRIVHEAAVTACRPLPGSPVKRIFAFEVLSSTEWSPPAIGAPFVPVHFVAINDHLDAKRAALECYKTEMRDFPHPRSFDAIEALARVRGSHAGLAAAEAFEIILDIQD